MQVVDSGRDDQVDGPELVLDQHEDDAVCRRGALSRHRHPRDCYLRTVAGRLEVTRREHARRQVGAQQLHRVHAHREARRTVVGEHALPHARLGELRRRRSRFQR